MQTPAVLLYVCHFPRPVYVCFSLRGCICTSRPGKVHRPAPCGSTVAAAPLGVLLRAHCSLKEPKTGLWLRGAIVLVRTVITNWAYEVRMTPTTDATSTQALKHSHTDQLTLLYCRVRAPDTSFANVIGNYLMWNCCSKF